MKEKDASDGTRLRAMLLALAAGISFRHALEDFLTGPTSPQWEDWAEKLKAEFLDGRLPPLPLSSLEYFRS